MVQFRWCLSMTASFVLGALSSQLTANGLLGSSQADCPPCPKITPASSAVSLQSGDTVRQATTLRPANTAGAARQQLDDHLQGSLARTTAEPAPGGKQLVATAGPASEVAKKQLRSKTAQPLFKSAGDIGRKNGEAAYTWKALPGTHSKAGFMNTVQAFFTKRPLFTDCCPMAIKTIKRATVNIRTRHWEMKGYQWGDRHPQYLSFLLVAHAIADYILPEGLILEFGVASGGSITLTAGILKAKEDKRIAYGFDTFTGLPEDWKEFKAGAFAYDKSGKLPPVPPQVVLKKGLFTETLPRFLEQHKETAAFINVDCDLYTGAISVLKLLAPRMRPGTIVHFHELNQIGFADELKALYDFLIDHPKIKMEILNAYAHPEAALLRVVSVGEGPSIV